MTRSLRAAAYAAVASLALSLGSCAAAPLILAAGGAVAMAADTYCRSVTDEARQAVRDRLTEGVPVIRCSMEGR